MTTFFYDLKQGQLCENQLASILRKRNPGCEVSLNESIDIEELRQYDVILKKRCGTTVAFECKLDRKAAETGNVAVEIDSITNSKSDYVVYMLSAKLYYIKREDLIELAQPYREVWGGDGNRSRLKLVPAKIFKKKSTLLKP